MKTEKLIWSLLHTENSGRTKAITALIGGLAIGAVVGILFATDKGKAARQKIKEIFSNLFSQDEEGENCEQQLAPNQKNQNKRPKSDIKSLTQHVHN